ncbi:DUF4239 domain-containing protein [Polynucleobacter paneuropaeus]|nr:DUF4239 domain-containing protein [Polynucleobacter paneuropaeus]MBT8577511.1 DUF4239 domain-containing protein [Polynucleobacter paneuropaeus]
MGVVFSLIFAFITVLVWQNYNNVSDATFKEASKLNNIYCLLSALPPEIDRAEKQLSLITHNRSLLMNGLYLVKINSAFLLMKNS